MAESPWMNHAEALAYCHLPKGSRVLYTAARADGPKRVRSARVGNALMFKREWLDLYIEALADLNEPPQRQHGSGHAA